MIRALKESDFEITYTDKGQALLIGEFSNFSQEELLVLKKNILELDQLQTTLMAGYTLVLDEVLKSLRFDAEIVNKIKDRLKAKTGQTNYITEQDFDLIIKQIGENQNED